MCFCRCPPRGVRSRCSFSPHDVGAWKGTCVHMRVTAAPPCYLSARDYCAAVLPFAYGQSLPASRTVLRPLRPMTVRARVPCMHSDLVTRVERSANNHPDRPGVFARDIMRVITDTPPVADERTLDDEERVRLAQLEYVRAREQAKSRERKAVNKRKAKLKALHEQMLKLTEVM